MRVILTAIGTSGDVFPFIGLGMELKKRAHDVIVISHGHFGPEVERARLDFVSVGTAEEYHNCLTSNPRIWDPLGGYPEVVQCANSLAPQMYDAVQDNMEPDRTVVVAHYLDFASRLIQERYDVPVVTAVVPPMGFRFAHRYLDDAPLLPPLEALRSSAGKGWNFSTLLSIGLFPQWFASPESDWPAEVPLTGFPLFVGTEPTPPDVDAFLAEGTAPIVFMAGPRVELAMNADRRAFFKAAVEACALLGRRGLVLGAFSETPGDVSPSMHYARFAPLTRILPRCAAIVHHGGIGTIAAAMASGVPQIATPVCHDQPDNGARMKQLGVGDCLPFESADGESVASTLRDILVSPDVAARCQVVAERCSRMDGIAATCDLIESVAPRPSWRVTVTPEFMEKFATVTAGCG